MCVCVLCVCVCNIMKNYEYVCTYIRCIDRYMYVCMYIYI